MPELSKDSSIKLFGRRIPVFDGLQPPETEVETLKDLQKEDSEEEIEAAKVYSDGPKSTNEDQKTSSEEAKSEADGPKNDKVLKKPDKILPCPRCNSMDTKFCYYNNYNVSQPRHFCKKCQRYWTAGGNMRNVPVGAGRRKSKHLASQYRQIMMAPDCSQPLSIDIPDSPNHQAIPSCATQNPKVVKFGGEVPPCESNQNKNVGFNSSDNKEDPSCASSATVQDHHADNTINNEKNGANGYCNGATPLPHFQYYPGAPWAYPWSSGWQNVPSKQAGRCSSEFVCGQENGNSNPIPWMAAPAFCPPAIPFAFFPASFWGCLPSWPISPVSDSCSGNGSPTLGKRSRDAGLGEEKTERSLWIPKTLRIDDPDEAAKSSIWATLGIKPEENGLFKPFQSKPQTKSQTPEAAKVLHANPAALSRSQSFWERG